MYHRALLPEHAYIDKGFLHHVGLTTIAEVTHMDCTAHWCLVDVRNVVVESIWSLMNVSGWGGVGWVGGRGGRKGGEGGREGREEGREGREEGKKGGNTKWRRK